MSGANARTGTVGAAPWLQDRAQGGDIHSKYCETYRSFDVQVETDATERVSFDGRERRFKVRSSVSRRRCNKGISEVIGTFTGPVGFLSDDEALQYGASRAHLMIDCMLKLPNGEDRPVGPRIGCGPLHREYE